MTFKQAVSEIITGKKPLVDVWHYLVGNYRYFLWYWNLNCRHSKYFKGLYVLRLHRLIRKHIREQIEYRFKYMDEKCFNSGECKLCGCETTKLQMANKPCKKPCYPRMMSKKDWINFVNGKTFSDENGIWIAYLTQANKPYILKEHGKRNKGSRRVSAN
jgi:hypothetical protein